jgi:hypothetical protein
MDITRIAKLHRFVRALDVRAPDNACIMSALTVRDALQQLGYSARVKPVALLLRAVKGGQMLHSLGVGLRDIHGFDAVAQGTGWDGHLVVIAEGHLIDPMLPKYRREAWADALPEHVRALPLAPHNLKLKPIISAKAQRVVAAFERTRDDYLFQAVWFAAPGNNEWHGTRAATEDRTDFVRELVENGIRDGLQV